MSLRTQFIIFWLGLIALTCGSVPENENGFSEKDGAFYTEDAVFMNAVPNRVKRAESNSTRDAKQIMFLEAREATNNSEPDTSCETKMGKKGTCVSYRDCYPLFDVIDFHVFDIWRKTDYTFCGFVNAQNVEVLGVCCTELLNPPPQQQPDVQSSGVLPPAVPVIVPPMPKTGFPNGALGSLTSQWLFNAQRQIPANWPPPIPTHPPDHTAATHPPSIVAGGQPITRPTTVSTTWATRPPASTTKQTWPPVYPTQPTKPPSAPVVGGACGMKNGPQTYGSELQDEERIVGGHNADLNEWPWIVALFNGGRQFCGGSLIDDRHVLTAAHCVAHMTSWDVARLTARLGDHNIATNTETQHVERKIKRVVRHRGFDMRTLYNDVAVLTLDQPVTFTKTIRPVCLPSGGRSYAGLYATVIGWGSLKEGGHQPQILQEVTISVWTNAECRLKYGSAAPGGIVDHMLCAGKANMDSCSGDSGGPLMVNEGGRWTQVGVVSWGIGCGKGQYPGVYTRVTAFLPWIQKNAQ